MVKMKRLFADRTFVTVLWFGLSLFAVVKMAIAHHFNNYQIFKYSFLNLIHQQNLYTPQPAHFGDLFHYGPVFALIIAPFSYLPDGLGCVLWTMLNAWLLYKAILMLPLSDKKTTMVLLMCAHELMTASYGEQINPMIAALIIFSFVFIRNEQDWLAALMIALGTFTKLYGIVGLAFFFLSKNKIQFVVWGIIWSAVLFVLPMAISSPHFIVQCYHDWYVSVSEKNISNATSLMQDISVMGMIRRLFNYQQLSDALVILPGIVLFATSYLRISAFKFTGYQLLLLSSTLIFPIIFSTSSESPTYIIAFAGVGIWFANLQKPTLFEVFLFVFAFLITSLSPSDLFPQYINTHYIRPYSLKALPCLLIWLKIIAEILTRSFHYKPSKSLVQHEEEIIDSYTAV